MAGAEQDAKTKAGAKDNRRRDRKLPALKVQRMLAAIEKRISASEDEKTPLELKLKPKELIGLANSAAGLSRVLREVDRETAQDNKRLKLKTGVF